MFSKSVVESDAFLDLTHEAQALYLHLSINADDDGFVSNPRRVAKQCDCTEEHPNGLINAGFILRFDSGVVVVTDWLICNYIQKDRYKPTLFVKEKSKLNTDITKRYVKTDC